MSERHERYVGFGVQDGNSVSFERHERFTGYEVIESSAGGEAEGETMMQQVDG